MIHRQKAPSKWLRPSLFNERFKIINLFFVLLCSNEKLAFSHIPPFTTKIMRRLFKNPLFLNVSSLRAQA